MEEKKIKRKEWVKTAIIIFLLIMLVLTFFSNTIMNYSLPEVATEYITGESITMQVRGTGVVEAGDPYNVIIDENRVIKSVVVSNGDVVEKGDALFYLEGNKSADTDALEKQIEDAELAYQQALMAENVSLTVYNNVVNGVATNTNDYQNKIQGQKNNISQLKNAISAEQTKRAQAQAKLLELNAADTDINTATANSNAAHTALNTAQAEYNECKRLLDEFDAAANAGSGSGDAGATGSTGEDSGNTGSTGEGDGTQGSTPTPAPNPTPTPTVSREELAANLAAAENRVNQSKSAVNLADSILALVKQVISADANITTHTNNLALNEAALTQLQTDVQMELSLGKQRDDIKDLKEQLAKMNENAAGGIVYAPVSGTVSGISRMAGETVSAGEALAVIMIEGKGYNLSFSVSKKQAASLNVGDKGEISNSWYYYDVVATLLSIKPDPQDPTNSKKLTFNIEGDVTAGQTLTLSVGQRSSNYDLTVPNNAVREDKDGKFILVLTQKPSPLGNRYYAERRDVEVLAGDDRRSAIKGDVYAYEFVVTTSTKPIEEGQQVRLREE